MFVVTLFQLLGFLAFIRYFSIRIIFREFQTEQFISFLNKDGIFLDMDSELRNVYLRRLNKVLISKYPEIYPAHKHLKKAAYPNDRNVIITTTNYNSFSINNENNSTPPKIQREYLWFNSHCFKDYGCNRYITGGVHCIANKSFGIWINWSFVHLA